VGGVLTGEHGVGIEKRDLMPEMFNRDRSRPAAAVKCAFDEKGCSIPARCFPPCIAAPNWAACMCAGRARACGRPRNSSRKGAIDDGVF
jgi:hypothetical protein